MLSTAIQAAVLRDDVSERALPACPSNPMQGCSLQIVLCQAPRATHSKGPTQAWPGQLGAVRILEHVGTPRSSQIFPGPFSMPSGHLAVKGSNRFSFKFPFERVPPTCCLSSSFSGSLAYFGWGRRGGGGAEAVYVQLTSGPLGVRCSQHVAASHAPAQPPGLPCLV